MNIEIATYDRLLNAAQELVQINGYNAFSYAHLAQTVGIKTASIHYHFPSKEFLGIAMVRRYRERFSEVLLAIESDNSGAVKRIEKYGEQFLATFNAGGKICLCGMLASDYETLPDNLRHEVREFFAVNQTWLTRIFEQGKAEGELRFSSEASELASTFLSSLEGSMLGARVFGDENRIRAAIECWQTLLTAQAS